MPDRGQILRSYGQFVNRLWEDETLLERLKADPHTVLNEFGFDIPPEGKINLLFGELNVNGSPMTQANMLDKSEETGVYDIIVPSKPADVEISDLPLQEEVLELMAGGAAEAGCCPCCCCCPCCGSSQPVA